MKQELYQCYIDILKEELVVAMGCTEPIALAYAGAIIKDLLQEDAKKIKLTVSGNIIKNVKSVVIPNTKGMKGLIGAVSAGFVAGDSKKQLEVISQVDDHQIEMMKTFMNQCEFEIKQSLRDCQFDLVIDAYSEHHYAHVHIIHYHTNVVKMVKDDEIILNKEVDEEKQMDERRQLLNVENIVEFAKTVDINDVKTLLDRQIEYNMNIAKEGMKGKWGAQIGQIILKSYGNSVANRAKAFAAAGSDARMNGCEMPVVINSGSGNQGMTTSIPVIIYAKELYVSDEQLYRALVLANLVTIHLKTGIGRLSAYCGVTSAGCGAAAGICYLYGGDLYEISHTIVNAVAINSGVVCDGAKSSCAAKIATAIEAGLLGMQMSFHDSQFYGGDGILAKGVEKTIKNIGRLASGGMKQTDKEILNIMLEE